jgi:hypothetical protein
MSNSLSKLWWIWWGNPLNNLHPDNKKIIDPHLRLSKRKYSYDEIGKLRKALNLSIKPEKEIIMQNKYGFVSFLDPEENIVYETWLSALTFDQRILEMSQTDWEKTYHISNKNQIRTIIQKSRSVPNSVIPLVNDIVKYSNPNNSTNIISIQKRTITILYIFFSFRFPVFAKRWRYSLPESITRVTEHLNLTELLVISEFCDFISSEIDNLIVKINDSQKIPDIDFTSITSEIDNPAKIVTV